MENLQTTTYKLPPTSYSLVHFFLQLPHRFQRDSQVLHTRDRLAQAFVRSQQMTEETFAMCAAHHRWGVSIDWRVVVEILALHNPDLGSVREVEVPVWRVQSAASAERGFFEKFKHGITVPC